MGGRQLVACKMRILKRLAFSVVLAMAPILAYADTPQEVWTNEYNVCILMNNGPAWCQWHANVSAWIEACVEKGNDRWLNWGIHGDCVDKAKKIFNY
jgi:hypothetical protein